MESKAERGLERKLEDTKAPRARKERELEEIIQADWRKRERAGIIRARRQKELDEAIQAEMKVKENFK